MKKFIYFVVMIMFAAGMTGCIDDPERGALREGEIHTPWTSVDILVGESVQIKASLGRETFQWKSENPTIATVTQDGLVEGRNLGTAKIVVSVGGASKTITVNVRGRSVNQIIQFGNGALVRYGSEISDVLVRDELFYKDNLDMDRKVVVPPDIDSVFLPGYRTGLSSVSVYMVGSDTARSEPMGFTQIRNVSRTARLQNSSEINAREFDFGPDSWYDLDPQNRLGGTHRDELGDHNCGVDIGATGVVEASAGEWLQYTVMAEDGYYFFDMELAVDGVDGSDVAVEIDGQSTEFHFNKTTTGSVIVSYVWYYEDTQDGKLPEFFLAKGPHIIKLRFLNGEVSLRKFLFKTINIPKVEATLNPDSIYIHDARDFDLGGEGVGYHDRTANNTHGNYDYRNALGDPYCGVDIEPSGNIGGIEAGEWQRYTLNVAEEGDYYVDIRVSVGGNRNKFTYSLQLDRDPKETHTVFGNSSWSQYAYQFEERAIEACPKLHLTAGQHRLKIIWEEDDGINFRFIKFTPAALFTSKGIRVVTRFGNGTLVRWYDCWHFPYSISYTDVNNQQKTMDVPTDLLYGNLLLPDFKTGLSYINKNGGSRIDVPDDSIKDIRHNVVGIEPCVINAIEFDYGTENGEGRYDIDPSSSGALRAYRVALGDILCSVDINGPGNDPATNYISAQKAGEWVEYTINVDLEGFYDFDANVNGNNNTAYSLLINNSDGIVSTKMYWYLQTNGWVYEANPTVDRPRIFLKSGKNVLRYVIRNGGADIRQIRLKYYNSSVPVEPPEGFDKINLFGNAVAIVSFKDNGPKDYTMTYINTSDQPISLSVPRDANSMILYDYKSDLQAKAAGYPDIFTPNASNTKSIRHTISATNPTIIPIVDYDYGGEGIGFHEESGRSSSSSYRSSLGDKSVGVDIEGSGEPTQMNIGYVANGEWLQYTLHAEAAGDYSFDFNISVNNANAKYALTVNGVKTEDYSLGHHNTGGWGNYYWFHRHWEETRPVVHLNEGANTVRIHIIGGNYNMKSFRFDNVLSLPYMTTGWTAASRNGNHNWESASGLPGAVLDGDQRTGWHSSNAELPQCLVVDMKETKAIDHLCLLYMFNGITTNKWVYLKDVKVYLTDTPDVVPDIEQASWGAAVADVTIDLFSASNNGKDAGSEVTRIDLASGSSGRYLILYFPNSRSGNYISFMELEVYQ